MHIPLIASLKWQLRATLQHRLNAYRLNRGPTRPKVFCIGLNKTGTTSWARAMSDIGYIVASETKATLYFDDWRNRDFDRILRFCRSGGDAFQDIPFSLPDTYHHLDNAFPDARFVLTVRDSADQWYRSLTTFHSKACSRSGNIPPTPADVANARYWRRGFLAEYCKYVLGTPTDDPYNRTIATRFYDDYVSKVQDYFSSKPDRFLVINVAKDGEHNRLRRFLGVPPGAEQFPWENKT